MREEAVVRISTRKRLWMEQQFKCGYCHRTITLEQASLDHIVPVDKMDIPLGEANLIVTCKPCNKRKGNHIVISNLYDKEIYPLLDVPVIFQDYYIHKTKKIK